MGSEGGSPVRALAPESWKIGHVCGWLRSVNLKSLIRTHLGEQAGFEFDDPSALDAPVPCSFQSSNRMPIQTHSQSLQGERSQWEFEEFHLDTAGEFSVRQ